MSFSSFIKNKFFSLSAVLVVAAMLWGNGASAEFFPEKEELSAYCSEIYQKARADFGRSFNGYCGTYIRCQLKAIGIFDGGYDFHANGNGWYDVFNGVEETSGGYRVVRESGRDCLEKLMEEYGSNLKNVLVSFPIQANYSSRYPGAGHALLIHEIIDGVAYYSESFSFGKFREGQLICEDVESLMNRYQRNHGGAKGCVMFTEKNEGYVIDNSSFMKKTISEDKLLEKMLEALNASIVMCDNKWQSYFA